MLSRSQVVSCAMEKSTACLALLPATAANTVRMAVAASRVKQFVLCLRSLEGFGLPWCAGQLPICIVSDCVTWGFEIASGDIGRMDQTPDSGSPRTMHR